VTGEYKGGSTSQSDIVVIKSSIEIDLDLLDNDNKDETLDCKP
jgi:hypothetical protein